MVQTTEQRDKKRLKHGLHVCLAHAQIVAVLGGEHALNAAGRIRVHDAVLRICACGQIMHLNVLTVHLACACTVCVIENCRVSGFCVRVMS